MMKLGMGSFDRFAEMFNSLSREACKKQCLIPYFIDAHPGTTDEDMKHLVTWRQSLKRHQIMKPQGGNFRTQNIGEHRGRGPRRLSPTGYHISTDAAISSPNCRNTTRRGVFFRHISPICLVMLA